jgi:O-acetylhomoserine (thiol)-lyase
MSGYRFDTVAIHAGQKADPVTGATAVPIYQTAAFAFDSAEAAADTFALRRPGNIYTRIMNPTTAAFEERTAALEGGVGALATSSGQAAVTIACLTIAGAGDEIVSSASLYGGTHNLFFTTLARLGLRVITVDPGDPRNFRRAITPRTKAVYAETIGNPGLDVLDTAAVAAAAHEAGVPLIIDSTFATPYLCRPIEHGADIVVHSATKFICGHGTTIGGVIVDAGRFDWRRGGRFPCLCEPDPSYHNGVFLDDFGPRAYISRARLQVARDLGACPSPFSSFLLLLGLETLSLRMTRHSANALAVARYLRESREVAWVNYPGLPGRARPDLDARYLPAGGGAIVTFGLKGGMKAASAFLRKVSLFTLAPNLGDTRSLVIHPATTTHAQLPPEERTAAGAPDDLIRLSVGLEDPADLVADLDQALRAAGDA